MASRSAPESELWGGEGQDLTASDGMVGRGRRGCSDQLTVTNISKGQACDLTPDHAPRHQDGGRNDRQNCGRCVRTLAKALQGW